MPKIALLLMSALAVAAVLAGEAAGLNRAGSISRVAGGPSVRVTGAPDSSVRQSQSGDPVYVSDLVETSKSQTVTLALLDDSEIVLAPGTSVRIATFLKSQSSPSTILHLLYGTTRALVRRAYVGPSQFMLTTPNASMGVRGTHFIASYDPDSGTTLHVLRGTVALGPADVRGHAKAETRVTAGQKSVLSINAQAPTAPAPFDPREFHGRLRLLSPDFDSAVGPDNPAADSSSSGGPRRSLQDALQSEHAQDPNVTEPNPNQRDLRGGPPPLSAATASLQSQTGAQQPPAAAAAINPNPLGRPGASANPAVPGNSAAPGATSSRPTVGTGAGPTNPKTH